MNELQEYLSKTKKRRELSKRIAQSILDSTCSVESRLKFLDNYDSQFPAPSPKRFTEYKEGVNEKLKEIYNPQYKNPMFNTIKTLKTFSHEKVYKQVYLENTVYHKHKPKIIPLFIPKRAEGSFSKSVLGKRVRDSPVPSTNASQSTKMSRARSELKRLYLINP